MTRDPSVPCTHPFRFGFRMCLWDSYVRSLVVIVRAGIHRPPLATDSGAEGGGAEGGASYKGKAQQDIRGGGQ